jgi:Zn-dependent protease with chaperone function
MILAGILLGYATTVALLGGVVIRRIQWVSRYPRLGMWSWLAAFLSVFVAVAMAGLLMVTADLAHLVATGTFGSSAHLAAVTAQTACMLVLIVALVGSAAGTGAVARSFRQMRRDSDQHLSRIRVASRFDPELGTLVVASDGLAAYSIAGSSPSIVLTEGVIATLSKTELSAVIAHEVEHLRGRHAFKLAAASGLRRTFKFVPLFRTGHDQLVDLLEMVADDQAARTCGRRNVASAVLRIAEARSPQFAMSASSGNVGIRVRRLMQPEPRLGLIRAAFGVMVLSTVVAFPAVGLVSSAAAAGPNVTCATAVVHSH